MPKVIMCSRNILDNANDFYYIAKRIVDDIDTKYKHYPVQFFVNSLFAIELYLKTIYVANYKEYPQINNHGIHNLSKLYNMISNKDKEKLNKINQNIENVLKEYCIGFEKWRYSHENDILKGDQETILNILKNLKEYCNNEYKEIISEIYNNEIIYDKNKNEKRGDQSCKK